MPASSLKQAIRSLTLTHRKTAKKTRSEDCHLIGLQMLISLLHI